MKKTIMKIVAIILCVVVVSATFMGCQRQSDRVSYNLSLEADNFNITRRLAVINTRSDKPVFEMIGRFSIETDTVDNQLEITVETEKGVYKKHFIYLNDWVTYVVEDVSGADVNTFVYEVNYLPEAFKLIDIVTKE